MRKYLGSEARPPHRLGSIETQKQVCAMHNPNASDHDGQTETMPSPPFEPPDTMTVEIAHKFRELLTIALFSLEQLQRQSLDDQGREQLQRADRAVGQIGEIINRIQPI
jgi:signal transduction histidine kinase